MHITFMPLTNTQVKNKHCFPVFPVLVEPDVNCTDDVQEDVSQLTLQALLHSLQD